MEFRYVTGGGTTVLQGMGGNRQNDYFLATVGLGVTVRDRITVLPSASSPIALKGGKRTFSLGASISFGH